MGGAGAEVKNPTIDNVSARGSIGRIGPAAAALARGLREAEAQLNRQAVPTEEKARIRSELYEAANADLARVVTAEGVRVDRELETLEAGYERRARLHAAELDSEAARLGRKLAGMTAEELAAAGQKAINADPPPPPHELDVISAHLKAADPTLHKTLRETASARGWYRPWELGEGKALTIQKRAIAAALRTPGGVPLAVDGAAVVVSLTDLGGSDE